MTGLTAMFNQLAAGSTSYKWVVAIEGYSNLLTDVRRDRVTPDWWTGTDWATLGGIVDGIVVELDQKQQMSPWDPLQGGGTAKIHVPPTVSDAFGIDWGSRGGGIESEITASISRIDDIITVRSTAGFPASGIAYIGTECFSYSSTTATQFVDCTRGLFSPFFGGGGTLSVANFAHDHQLRNTDVNTALRPVVSSVPRVWSGRWIGVWMVPYNPQSGLPSDRTQSALVFAGQITEVRDDPETAHTVIMCSHFLDYVKEAVLLRDQWSAEVIDGINLPAGLTVTMNDSRGTSTPKTANPFSVVASGAVAPNQINAGRYSLTDLYSALNSWLAAEVLASRLYANTYAFGLSTDPGTGPRTVINYEIDNGGTGNVCSWRIVLPPQIADFFGFTGQTYIGPTAVPTDTNATLTSGDVPGSGRILFAGGMSGGALDLRNEVGNVVDNYAYLPIGAGQPPTSGGLTWGVFLLDNTRWFVASKVGTQLTNCSPITGALAGIDPATFVQGVYDYPIDISRTDPITIRQVFIIESSLASLLSLVFYNTGNNGYNDPDWDVLGPGFGIGVPAELLGPDFLNSVNALPGANLPSVLILDKPTKIGGDNGALSSELTLRRAFPIWKYGGLRFTTWTTPAIVNALATLDESTKAEPAKNTATQRSATTLTAQYVKTIVKINYNRDITQLGSDVYQKFLTLEDRTAIDDAGGAGVVCTLNARNTYGQFAATGAGIEALAPGFLAMFPLFSRPMSFVRRSITPRFYEQLAPGDCVIVTDKFARDPTTGKRGITNRPGLITRITYNPGGPVVNHPDQVRDMAGEVDIVFLDLNRIGAYAPSGRVDETANTAPFTAGYDPTGTGRLTLKAHEYSEAGEAADASWFAANDKIAITELDPANLAAPLTWSRVVQSVAGNIVTLTAALSAPAFDTTKKYGITYDHYALVQPTQVQFAFQADDADGLVENLAPAYQYGVALSTGAYTSSTASDVPERLVTQAYGDGRAFDVGNDRALARLIGNLADHKTRHVKPTLSATVAANTTFAGYRLLMCKPVYLTTEKGTAHTARYLKIAPWFRSATGASVTIRITLASKLPSGALLDGVTFNGVYYQATWTTSSTVWQQGAVTTFPETVKGGDGIAFLLVEGTQNAETRGPGACFDTERVAT